MKEYKNYNLSKDYAALFELAKTQTVICIVDYMSLSRDVCTTYFADRIDEIHVHSRGQVYIVASGLDDFIHQCNLANLEWLVPSLENK